jgi:hypothetical protein
MFQGWCIWYPSILRFFLTSHVYLGAAHLARGWCYKPLGSNGLASTAVLTDCMAFNFSVGDKVANPRRYLCSLVRSRGHC